jgi:hypothetical protein
MFTAQQIKDAQADPQVQAITRDALAHLERIGKPVQGSCIDWAIGMTVDHPTYLVYYATLDLMLNPWKMGI